MCEKVIFKGAAEVMLAEAHAALADERVVAIRQVADKFLGIGSARGGHELVFAGSWTTEEQVIADGAVEEEDFLGLGSDMAAQKVEWQCAQVVADDAHSALLGVVVARQQVGYSGLAGAGGAD